MTLSEKQKKLLAGGGVALFLLLLALLFWFAGRPLLQLAAKPQAFRAFVERSGPAGRLIFIGIVLLQVIVAFIPGEPFEICAGYAFGAFEGTALCLAGAALGSAAVFGLVRWIGVPVAELFFPREKLDSLRFLKNEKQLELLVFLLFFIPGTPKDLLCYAVGLTRIRFGVWMLITCTARIPSVVTSTIGGDALGMGKLGFAAAVFGATALISLLGILAYRRICAARERDGGAR